VASRPLTVLAPPPSAQALQISILQPFPPIDRKRRQGRQPSAGRHAGRQPQLIVNPDHSGVVGARRRASRTFQCWLYRYRLSEIATFNGGVGITVTSGNSTNPKPNSPANSASRSGTINQVECQTVRAPACANSISVSIAACRYQVGPQHWRACPDL
jgi:hypothetical protein